VTQSNPPPANPERFTVWSEAQWATIRGGPSKAAVSVARSGPSMI